MSDDASRQTDSYTAMIAAVQAFHDKYEFQKDGGEDLTYRVALMAEELGEISSVITKGQGTEALAEECADLFILVLGTAISAEFDLKGAFWAKMERLMGREKRMINGRVRVSATFGDEAAAPGIPPGSTPESTSGSAG
jgi:NTP pyrophosphatase (non-canonical NTP hydrolase)